MLVMAQPNSQIDCRLLAGENEIYMGVGKYNEHVTVIAVRDESGKLLGYYERFEKVGGQSH
jgi:hypothetical protein